MNQVVEKEYLSGTIERITYHNPENGFCVLRVKVKGHKDLVTIVGNVPHISVGEYIESKGIWHNNRDHGQQFKADFLKSLPPTSLEGIEKYLGSGLIKGIGAHFAKKLVANFGEEVFEVIENKSELLTTVDGIGKIRVKNIRENWQEQKVVRKIMVFLQSHGIGTSRATRIYKTYGDEAIEIVSNNPYRLAKDIRGIGFISADTIAKNLGIDSNSLIRARAGINHVLLEATSDGHCGLPLEMVIGATVKLLEIEKSLIELAIEKELESGDLTKDKLNEKDALFLTGFYAYEQNIANMLIELNQYELPWEEINAEKAIEWIENKLTINLAAQQQEAIKQTLQNKIMVITGGPGTGKTTIVYSILKILQAKKVKIKLCAPTGRAAKRLSETTGMEAITMHRLLEIDPTNGCFKYNKDNKLKCDFLVIDEMSMVDVSLFYSLLQALPNTSAILLVGDVDQLPSVGAGKILNDIINSKAITTVVLTEIFRQAESSKIITNAHRINKGYMPNLESHEDSDFYFINAEAGDDLLEKLIKIVNTRIPDKFSFHPKNDIQILCPMQRGGSGVRSLNIELQKILNPDYENGIMKFGQYFSVGDKVMQTENDHDREVYNGDIGNIVALNQVEQEAVINFYDRDVVYSFTDFDRITLSYATTIHKSQGSEYPVVVIPLTMQSYLMLKRNLIYTAITRGKKLVVIIGEKKALAIAVRNNTGLKRYTKLKDWLELENYI